MRAEAVVKIELPKIANGFLKGGETSLESATRTANLRKEVLIAPGSLNFPQVLISACKRAKSNAA